MYKLNYLSAIHFSGADAASFLHSQLSADILGLDNGGATFACYCEPKGRVLALLLVFKSNEDFYVILSDDLAITVSERLKIYRMRSKVEFDIVAHHSILGYAGTQAPGISDESATIIPVPGSHHRIVLVPGEKDENERDDRLQDWRRSELSLGIAWLNADTSGQFLPQMLGYEKLGAVNYRKGCYPGQEIVARTHYLGKVKRHPRVLNCQLQDCPKPMEKIRIFDDSSDHDAVVADCVQGNNGAVCLFVVTRMDPDLIARKIQYKDVVASLDQIL